MILNTYRWAERYLVNPHTNEKYSFSFEDREILISENFTPSSTFKDDIPNLVVKAIVFCLENKGSDVLVICNTLESLSKFTKELDAVLTINNLLYKIRSDNYGMFRGILGGSGISGLTNNRLKPLICGKKGDLIIVESKSFTSAEDWNYLQPVLSGDKWSPPPLTVIYN